MRNSIKNKQTENARSDFQNKNEVEHYLKTTGAYVVLFSEGKYMIGEGKVIALCFDDQYFIREIDWWSAGSGSCNAGQKDEVMPNNYFANHSIYEFAEFLSKKYNKDFSHIFVNKTLSVIFSSEEQYIKNKLESYLTASNLENTNKKSLDNIFINKIVGNPGAVGCYYENEKWYLYQVDDHFHLLANGPFSLNGIVVGLASELCISKKYRDLSFSDSEYETYLQGMKPVN